MTTDLVSQAAATPSDAIARIGAERALRLTEEYVAVISHELRTPFSAVIYWAQLLQKSPGDRDNVLRAAQAIERSARLQTHLVNNLLSAQRMVVEGETGQPVAKHGIVMIERPDAQRSLRSHRIQLWDAAQVWNWRTVVKRF